MSAAKDRMVELIHDQPDDASYEEILRELAFEQMIARGLKDSRDRRTLSNEAMKNRIGTWGK